MKKLYVIGRYADPRDSIIWMPGRIIEVDDVVAEKVQREAGGCFSETKPKDWDEKFGKEVKAPEAVAPKYWDDLPVKALKAAAEAAALVIEKAKPKKGDYVEALINHYGSEEAI